jgi:S1-C subfamily serine protease
MRTWKIVAASLAAAMAFTAHAGDMYSCKAEAQACLNEMTAKLKGRGWVGIEMDEDAKTKVIKVTRVVEDSPAKAGGLQAGDVLVAVNGVKFGEGNEAELKKAKETMVPGATAKYTVNRSGKEVLVSVKLGELPPAVLHQWIGQHMMEHHAKAQLAAKTEADKAPKK